MFARPRPKKNILHAPSKKRKNAHAIEEISYDPEARSDYLTGFHKRKLQRQKIAQEQLAKQARQEKIDARREVSYDIMLFLFLYERCRRGLRTNAD